MHLFRIASNQYAIWIEDGRGGFVRSLFATDFVARRAGWKKRPQTVPTWIKAANVPNLSQGDIDAVRGPTPGNGIHTVVWDLRDAAGRLVPPGTYVYRIEGSIFWDSRVLWSGRITIGDRAQTSLAEAAYSPPGAAKEARLISQESAQYTPGK
jgi:hypothetical protein